MSSNKVCTIMDWPEPQQVKDIQSFLGFCNFYYCFIENYSNIVVPLTCLTCKGAPWNFSELCKLAFATLKEAFMSTPMLVHWVLDVQSVVETGASNYALGAILSIYSVDSNIYPITFYSYTFSALELNYDIHDKELLTIFEAFKVWRYYLEGPHLLVDIITNYKNLTYFSPTKILTCCQAPWSKYLSQFNLIICFHPGCLEAKPDALTRCSDIYLKGENSGYANANLYNFRPIFTQD